MKYLVIVLTGVLFATSAVAFNFRFAMFSQFNATSNVSPTIANGYKIYLFTSNGNFTVTN